MLSRSVIRGGNIFFQQAKNASLRNTTTKRRFSSLVGDVGLAPGLFQQVMTFPKRKPFETNVVVATLKTVLADYIVQMYLEKKETYDAKRGAVFTAFGCCYLGFVQWWIYVTLFGRICPNALSFANLPFKQKFPVTAANKAGWIDVSKQAFLDNFVHYTFVYFPVFYVFKNCFQPGGGESTEESTEKSKETEMLRSETVSIETSVLAEQTTDINIASADNIASVESTASSAESPTEPISGSLTHIVSGAMSQYKMNFWSDNMAMWGLWLPADFLIYSVPVWLRLPLNHAVSLGWICILSWMRGDN